MRLRWLVTVTSSSLCVFVTLNTQTNAYWSRMAPAVVFRSYASDVIWILGCSSFKKSYFNGYSAHIYLSVCWGFIRSRVWVITHSCSFFWCTKVKCAANIFINTIFLVYFLLWIMQELFIMDLNKEVHANWLIFS